VEENFQWSSVVFGEEINKDLIFMFIFYAVISHYFMFAPNNFIIFLLLLLVCLVEPHFYVMNEERDPYFTLFSF